MVKIVVKQLCSKSARAAILFEKCVPSRPQVYQATQRPVDKPQEMILFQMTEKTISNVFPAVLHANLASKHGRGCERDGEAIDSR
jgi:hypothetical protein